MVHKRHSFRNPMRQNGSRDDYAISVEAFNPIVVFDIRILCIIFIHPYGRPAAEQRQHGQRIKIHAVDGPFIMRRQIIKDDLFSS